MKSPGRNIIIGFIVEYASHLKNGVHEVNTALYVLYYHCKHSNGTDRLGSLFSCNLRHLYFRLLAMNAIIF